MAGPWVESKIPLKGTGRSPTKDESDQIIAAAQHGDVQVLLDLSSQGIDITAARGKHGQTPLTVAVIRGNVDLVNYLVKEVKADCNEVPQKWQEKLNELLQDHFKKLYYQAKHDLGSEKLHLLKIFIFGPPGAGKSSLLRVLLGGDPDPVQNSTGVCDRKLVQCTISVSCTGNKSTWKEIQLENEVQRLHSKIKETLGNKPTIPQQVDDVPNSHLQIEDDFFSLESEPTHQNASAISDVQFDSKHISTLIACYDSGGQPEYFDVMPTLTTTPTGYVMVLDMSKSLLTKCAEFYRGGKKYPENNNTYYTDAELMKTAIANIHTSLITEKISSKFGRLLVVGTHLDKCGLTNFDQDNAVVEFENTIKSEILNIIHVSTIKTVERQNKRLLHPVSNIVKKGRAEIAQEIRTAIENMSKYEKASEDIPVNWLLFQLEIRHNDKYYITRSCCADIATKCYIKEEDVDSILMYFHELGVLLYYRNIPALKHVVFCSPQWLFDKLTKLIEVKYDPPCDRAKRDRIRNGTFDKQLLKDTYSEDFITNDVLNYHHLCELFVSLNIMAILPGETDHYFMPALLNPSPENIDMSTYGRKIYDTLIVKFESEYVPRGVFCCLVVECMKNAIGWSILHGETAYKDLIIFQISTDLDLYVFLKDKIESITFEIYHNNKSSLQMGPNKLCCTLSESLKAVCSQLKLSSEVCLGFSCKRPTCGGFAWVQNELHFNQKISVCEKCNHRWRLQNDQMIWFSPQKLPSQQGQSALRVAADKDKGVFTSNYTKFCNIIMDLENLLKYFVTASIINIDDQSEILAPPRQTDKVTLLLRHISGPLEAGDTKPFRMMLDIMEKHGNLATKTLAIEIKKSLITNIKELDGLSGINTGQKLAAVTQTTATQTTATQTTATQTTAPNLSILDKTVAMSTFIRIAPMMAMHWEDVGYCLGVEDEDMEIIETEVLRSGDVRSAFKKVMKSWIRSTSGKTPKTWKTFVMVLQELCINTDIIVKLLQEEPA